MITINGFGFSYNFDFEIILSKISYYNSFFLSEEPSIITVTIEKSECVVLNSSFTKITCKTGNYSFSSVESLIQVYIENIGLAINVIILKF